MTERFNPGDDGPLERALANFGADMVFPETPDLVATLWTGLQPTHARQPWWRIAVMRRQFAAIAAVCIGVLVLSIPGTRSTVAGWLEVAGVHIEIGGDRGGGDDEPTSLSGESFLGRRVSLAEAAASVSFEVLIPAALAGVGEPEIYLDHRDGSPVISLLYAAGEAFPEIGDTGAGLLLTTFDPAGDTETYIKRTAADTSAEFLLVNGSWGAWIEDGSLSIPPEPNRPGVERPSAHVLIWDANGITIRMETAMTRDESLMLAKSMTPVHSPAPASPIER